MDISRAPSNIFEQQGPQEEALRRNELGIRTVTAMETLISGTESTLSNLPTYDYLQGRYDKHQKKEPLDTIHEFYPDIPKDVFGKEDLSTFRAATLAQKYMQEKEYQGLKKYRDPVFPALYDLASGLSIMTDPAMYAAMVAGGAAAGAGMRAAGLSASAIPIVGATGKVSAGALGKRLTLGFLEEMAQNTLSGMAVEYPLRQGSREFTGRDYTVSDVFKEAMLGAALISPVHVINGAMDSYFKGKKIFNAEDVKQAEAFSQYREALKEQMGELGIKGSHSDSYADFIKNHAYNYYSDNTKTFTAGFADNAPSGSLFGLRTGDYDTHFSPNARLNGTISLSSSGDVVRGTARATGGRGDLFYVDSTNLRLIKEDELVNFINTNPDIFPYIGILEGDVITPKEFSRLYELGDSEMAQLSADLSSRGYDGIVRPIEATSRQVEMVNPPSTVEIFKNRFDVLMKKDLGPLNYNKQIGYNPVATEASTKYNANNALDYIENGRDTAIFQSLSGEGYLSNGKKITMDAEGYFKSDIMKGSSGGQTYIEVFSKNMIDEIAVAQKATKDFDALIEKYPILSARIKEYLNQLDVYKEIADASMGKDIAPPSVDPAKIKRVFGYRKSIDAFVEKLKAENPENIEKIMEAYTNCIKRF